MISDENIAAAQIAQIFGSELLKAQQSARTDSGSVPDFVKINPKQFLVNENSKPAGQCRLEEQRLIQMLQKEAEAACPLPESSQSLTQNSSPSLPTHSTYIPQHTSSQLVVGSVATSVQPPSTNSVWEQIADSLERIATSLETVDILVKKKKVKRNRTSNEAHSQ